MADCGSGDITSAGEAPVRADDGEAVRIAVLARRASRWPLPNDRAGGW
jgi:hypothetical protein